MGISREILVTGLQIMGNFPCSNGELVQPLARIPNVASLPRGVHPPGKEPQLELINVNENSDIFLLINGYNDHVYHFPPTITQHHPESPSANHLLYSSLQTFSAGCTLVNKTISGVFLLLSTKTIKQYSNMFQRSWCITIKCKLSLL